MPKVERKPRAKRPAKSAGSKPDGSSAARKRSQETGRRGGKAGTGEAKRRDGAPICGGTKSNGEICTLKRGWGTDHPGKGKCSFHEKSSSALSEMRGEAKRLGIPIPVTPAQAIDLVMKLAAGQLDYVNQEVQKLSKADYFVTDVFGNTHSNKWIILQGRLMRETAHFAKVAADMGLQERQQKLAEQQAKIVGDMIRAIMDDVGLTKAQRKKFGPALRKQIVAMSDGQKVEVIG